MNKWAAILILLISCTPTKPYKRVAADPNVTPQKKAIIAPFVSAHFPIRERVTTDTIRIVDTVYDEKTVLVLSNIIDSLIMRGKDTIRDRRFEVRLVEQLKQAKKDCGRIITIREIVKDTIWQADDAIMFILKDQVSKLEAKNNGLSYELEVADKRVASAVKRANLMLLLFIISLLLLALIIWLFLKAKR